MARSQMTGKSGNTVEVAANGSLYVQDSIQKAVGVAPNDSADLPNGTTKGLYIGGAGNIVVTMADGVDATFTAITIGIVHPLAVKRVKATGTTATNILAVY